MKTRECLRALATRSTTNKYRCARWFSEPVCAVCVYALADVLEKTFRFLFYICLTYTLYQLEKRKGRAQRYCPHTPSHTEHMQNACESHLVCVCVYSSDVRYVSANVHTNCIRTNVILSQDTRRSMYTIRFVCIFARAVCWLFPASSSSPSFRLSFEFLSRLIFQQGLMLSQHNTLPVALRITITRSRCLLGDTDTSIQIRIHVYLIYISIPIHRHTHTHVYKCVSVCWLWFGLRANCVCVTYRRISILRFFNFSRIRSLCWLNNAAQ